MSDPSPRRAWSRLEPWRRRYAMVADILTPQRLALGLLALVLLVAGLFGGWDEAVTAEDDLATAEAGVVISASPFDLTPRKAFQGEALKPVAYASEGVRYLMVTVDVTNTSAEPVFSSTLTDALTITADGLSDARAGVFRINDSQSARAFSPDVTVPVVIVWQQDANASVPAEVTLTVSTHTYRRSTLDSSMGWRDPEPSTTVTLPVAPLPEA